MNAIETSIITAIITLEDLKNALHVKHGSDPHSPCDNCVVALALQKIFPEAWVTADGYARKFQGLNSTLEWVGDQKAKQIIHMFDNNEYREIEELLPAQVTFTRTA